MRPAAATVARVLAGTGLTAGLLAFGLFVTGTTARARSLLRPAAAAPGVAALDGSTTQSGEAVVDGEPTQVNECWAPGRSPGQVLAHYQRVAAGEAGQLPFLVEEAPGGGGAVVWVTEAGQRRAAVVRADPRGGASYRLLEVGKPRPGVRELPGGLTAPGGADVLLSVVAPDGSGTALLRAAGPVAGVVARCAAALEARGFVVEAAPAAAGAMTLAVRDARGPRGSVVVAPEGDGARVAITLRRG